MSAGTRTRGHRRRARTVGVSSAHYLQEAAHLWMDPAEERVDVTDVRSRGDRVRPPVGVGRGRGVGRSVPELARRRATEAGWALARVEAPRGQWVALAVLEVAGIRARG